MSLFSCSKRRELKHVTVADFKQFVDATQYVTDAEKFGWSIVQKTVYKFEVVDNATWQKPDGKKRSEENAPITQVSYNDAMAYCKWSNTRLPSYEEFWRFAEKDNRKINISTNFILPANKTNLVGNTWDITRTWNTKKEIRLAGGSYLCSENTCNGTNPERDLYVSPDTGNSNISFSVVIN